MKNYLLIVLLMGIVACGRGGQNEDTDSSQVTCNIGLFRSQILAGLKDGRIKKISTDKGDILINIEDSCHVVEEEVNQEGIDNSDNSDNSTDNFSGV